MDNKLLERQIELLDAIKEANRLMNQKDYSLPNIAAVLIQMEKVRDLAFELKMPATVLDALNLVLEKNQELLITGMKNQSSKLATS